MRKYLQTKDLKNVSNANVDICEKFLKFYWKYIKTSTTVSLLCDMYAQVFILSSKHDEVRI